MKNFGATLLIITPVQAESSAANIEEPPAIQAEVFDADLADPGVVESRTDVIKRDAASAAPRGRSRRLPVPGPL